MPVFIHLRYILFTWRVFFQKNCYLLLAVYNTKEVSYLFKIFISVNAHKFSYCHASYKFFCIGYQPVH